MVSLRRSKLCNGVLALSLCACGSSSFVTATELPKTPRQPDGVLVDPQPAVPGSRVRAPALGVVTLEPPVGNDALFGVVNKVFDAFARRNPSSLNELFVPGEIVQLDSRHTRGEIMQDWESRNRSMDYTALRGLDVVRIERMERFEYEDLSPVTSPARPEDMEPGDILVRLPVAAPLDPRNGQPLFKNVMVLVIRPIDRVLHIAGVGELDQP